MLLGLAHAEEMSAILGADIADQKEREEYVYIPTNAKGETMNQLRFKSAASLASGEFRLLATLQCGALCHKVRRVMRLVN